MFKGSMFALDKNLQGWTKMRITMSDGDWTFNLRKPYSYHSVEFCMHGKSQVTHPKKLRIRQRTRGEWMTSRRSGESSTLLEVIIRTDQLMDIIYMRILRGSRFLNTASLPLDAFAIYSNRRFPIHILKPPNEREPVTRNPTLAVKLWTIWHLRGWISVMSSDNPSPIAWAIDYGQREIGSLCGTLSKWCSEVLCFTIVKTMVSTSSSRKDGWWEEKIVICDSCPGLWI